MLRLLSLCLFLAAGNILLAQNNQKTVLYDDFSSNKNGWKEYFSGNYIDVVNNGKFIMENTNDGTHWSGVYAALNTSRNFSISVNTSHTSGVDNSHYGVYFGAKDGNNGYCFAISSNGWYRLFKYENSTFVNLIDWVQHSAIAKGNYVENRIKITKDGSDWKFYINDQYITSYGARTFFGDYVGFSVSRNQRVEYDNLSVIEYDGGSGSSPVNNNAGSDTQTDIFNDDFSDNKNNWQPTNAATFTTALSNGKFIVDVRDSTSVTSTRTVYYKLDKDFTYSLSLMHTSGVMNYGYGLVFDYTDTKNYYGFQISGDGYYRFYNLRNNTSTNLIPWTKTSSLKTGNYADNSISLKKQGSSVYLYINGQYINSASINTLTSQKIGFVVARPQRIEFDNMKLTGVYDDLDLLDDDDLDLDLDFTGDRDFSKYTKEYKSGNLCELIPSILKNAKDTFVHITSGLRYKGAWSNTYNTTYTIKDADSTTLSQSKYSGYLYAYLGTYSESEAKSKLESWKKKISDCLPGYTTFIPNPWKDGQSIYIGQKTSNGIVYSDASFYVSKNDAAYQLAFTSSSSYERKEFVYISNKTDNSEFSKQIDFLLSDAVKSFPAISGEMYKDGNNTLYKTNYQFPGSVENKITYFLGKTFESTLDVGITSQTDARAKMDSYAAKLKTALGSDYMYNNAVKSYFEGYTFNKKDRLYDDNSISIEIIKDYVKNTYKVVLKVRGTYQPSK
jgi:hypothetical protein